MVVYNGRWRLYFRKTPPPEFYSTWDPWEAWNAEEIWGREAIPKLKQWWVISVMVQGYLYLQPTLVWLETSPLHDRPLTFTSFKEETHNSPTFRLDPAVLTVILQQGWLGWSLPFRSCEYGYGDTKQSFQNNIFFNFIAGTKQNESKGLLTHACC